MYPEFFPAKKVDAFLRDSGLEMVFEKCMIIISSLDGTTAYEGNGVYRETQCGRLNVICAGKCKTVR